MPPTNGLFQEPPDAVQMLCRELESFGNQLKPAGVGQYQFGVRDVLPDFGPHFEDNVAAAVRRGGVDDAEFAFGRRHQIVLSVWKNGCSA